VTRTRPIVAIDGPSGAGKSTIGKLLAQRLGFLYLDTGAMYRCVGLLALRRGVAVDDEAALAPLLGDLRVDFAPDGRGGQRVICNGEDVTDAIRRHEVSGAASRASAAPAVRAKLVAMQRELAAAGGVVMEGRDIGTNVFPDAEVKFFLTATAAERARRRTLELAGRGQPADFAAVLAEQLDRDRRDSARELNPLIQAPDAVLVDATNMTIDEVVDHMARLACGEHPCGGAWQL
jgi:cytidylate kinase